MENIEQLIQMFPSLSVEEIKDVVINCEDEDDIFVHLSHLTEMKEKSTGIDPTLKTRFPRLTMEEISKASSKYGNRDELLEALRKMEEEKSRNIYGELKEEYTMSVIGGVLVDMGGNVQDTIETLKALKIQDEDPDLIPIENMKEEDRKEYEEREIEERRRLVLEESIILQKDLDENRNLQNIERIEHENRIRMLEAERDICVLTLKFNSNERFINLCYQFNKDYALSGYEWFGLYKEESSIDNYVTYVNVKSIIKMNSYQLKLPKENGYYIVKLVDGISKNILVESNAIHVGPRINFEAVLKEEEKKVLLYFNVEEGSLNERDWVSFTRKDKKHRSYISSHYLINYLKDETSGVVEVPMPRRPLQYEFRYFPSTSGYNPLKISNTIKVPKHDKLTLEFLEPVSRTKSQVKVTWDIHAVDVSSWDYVAMYKESDTKILCSQYVDMKNNHLIFDIPRTPGTYVLKYWAWRIGSAPLDVSEPIVVENRDTLKAKFSNNAVEVEWDLYSIDVSPKDWIALIKSGRSNKEYESYEYVRTCANHQVLEKMPKEKGEYEVRYFSHTKPKYEHLVASNKIIIE